MTIKNKIISISAACLFVASASQASATTLSYAGSGAFGSPDWHETVDRTIVSQNRSYELSAGMFRLLENGLESVLAFCIEPGVSLQMGEFDKNTPAAPWATALSNIDKLFNSAYHQVVDASSAAAFQLALWEIVAETENTLTLDSGNHYASADNANTIALGNTFLSGLGNATTGGHTLTTYTNDGQDLVSGTINPVPLPSSSLLLLGGLGGLVALRRRKKA